MKPLLPFAIKVAPKLLADDIFPYIPGDEENMKVWDDMMKPMVEQLRKDFDEKGIPFPEIVIDHSEEPIKLPKIT